MGYRLSVGSDWGRRLCFVCVWVCLGCFVDGSWVVVEFCFLSQPEGPVQVVPFLLGHFVLLIVKRGFTHVDSTRSIYHWRQTKQRERERKTEGRKVKQYRKIGNWKKRKFSFFHQRRVLIFLPKLSTCYCTFSAGKKLNFHFLNPLFSGITVSLGFLWHSRQGQSIKGIHSWQSSLLPRESRTAAFTLSETPGKWSRNLRILSSSGKDCQGLKRTLKSLLSPYIKGPEPKMVLLFHNWTFNRCSESPKCFL